jgi:diguanylate cyclase (GGDEF)-like protein
MKLASRLQRGRATPLLVTMWTLGIAAAVAVILLQQHADERRQAQVVLERIHSGVRELGSAPWTPAGDRTISAETRARSAVAARKRALSADLKQLDTLDADNASRSIAESMRPYEVTLGQVVDLVAAGLVDSARQLTADELEGKLPAIDRAIAAAEANYQRDATTGLRASYVGSVLAILLALGAFSVALLRSVRSRQRAEALAAENHTLLEHSRMEAVTDALTGLGNRRKLLADAEALLAQATDDAPAVLALFDLNGFKRYNDTFGHPAGDALLERLSSRLVEILPADATGYRMGGDEFCVLGRTSDPVRLAAVAADSLGEDVGAFSISSSHGYASMPSEACTVTQALQLADRRLYTDKRGSRPSTEAQVHDALVQVLAERNGQLGLHVGNVALLAAATAACLGLSEDDVARVRLAAELHDIGKSAIPEAILEKPGPLAHDEWAFMQRHTVIGERILAAAPALAEIAPLVRASHERLDGMGYPDGLSGEAIPLGARIVAVADSFDAITSARPYRPARPASDALAELRRCAGTQFDPQVVDAFVRVIEEQARRAA